MPFLLCFQLGSWTGAPVYGSLWRPRGGEHGAHTGPAKLCACSRLQGNPVSWLAGAGQKVVGVLTRPWDHRPFSWARGDTHKASCQLHLQVSRRCTLTDSSLAGGRGTASCCAASSQVWGLPAGACPRTAVEAHPQG